MNIHKETIVMFTHCLNTLKYSITLKISDGKNVDDK